MYPGIDLAYYGDQGQLKYDVIVGPGGDPDRVRLAVAGGGTPTIERDGSLVIATPGGTLRQPPPPTYQEQGGRREPVDAGYRLIGDHIGFSVGAYDRTRPLVIDPVLSYSTFLGGSEGDEALAVAADGVGSAYVTGGTQSADFPVTAGAFDTFYAANSDAFVAKLDPTGSHVVYATYLGGAAASDVGFGIAVDGGGNAYVTGRTDSHDFPTTPGAFDTSHNGGADGFVVKLDATGSNLLYGTFLGGSSTDSVQAIAVDAAGNAVVTGYTGFNLAQDFPLSANAFDDRLGGPTEAFVAKLDAAGSAVLYASYLGGGNREFGYGVAVDGAGAAYVTGSTNSADFPVTAGAMDTGYSTREGELPKEDAFVVKVAPDGSALLYATYLGGIDSDAGRAVVVDGQGDAHVTGVTGSTDFPTTGAALDRTLDGSGDAFVVELDATGSALLHATYLGGSGADSAWGIVVDAGGGVYVAGVTDSPDFPTTGDAVARRLAGRDDAFVAHLAAGGSSVVYATYLGGTHVDAAYAIALDGRGGVYVAGTSRSPGFPTTREAADPTHNADPECGNTAVCAYDAFVVKLGPAEEPGKPGRTVPCRRPAHTPSPPSRGVSCEPR